MTSPPTFDCPACPNSKALSMPSLRQQRRVIPPKKAVFVAALAPLGISSKCFFSRAVARPWQSEGWDSSLQHPTCGLFPCTGTVRLLPVQSPSLTFERVIFLCSQRRDRSREDERGGKKHRR